MNSTLSRVSSVTLNVSLAEHCGLRGDDLCSHCTDTKSVNSSTVDTSPFLLQHICKSSILQNQQTQFGDLRPVRKTTMSVFEHFREISRFLQKSLSNDLTRDTCLLN